MIDYPTSPDDARELAHSASEAIRALNHATMSADGCPAVAYPSDAYILLGALAEMTSRLPQLCDQLSAFLQRQLQFDLISVDGGEFEGDPLGAIGTACHALEICAGPAAKRLAGVLMQAQQAIAFASVRTEDASAN